LARPVDSVDSLEVEIFNADVWAAPPDETAAFVRERLAAVLGGAYTAAYPGGP
jgi:hypothetical protein